MKIINSLKKLTKYLIILSILSIIFLLALKIYFYKSTDKQFFTDLDKVQKSDYVLVLGCGVVGDQPSPLLSKRLESGIEIMHSKKANKIILSGYKDGNYYDEVSVMKKFLTRKGIREDKIIEDKKGDNTYYSIKNLEKIKDKSIIIVTQEWHLRRALYLANKLNIKNVCGLKAKNDNFKYYNIYMNFRESFARVKAVLDAHGLHLE